MTANSGSEQGDLPSTTPALPPGLAELNSVPRAEFLKDMQRHPLFMQSLDPNDAAENVELEALKALAYEGTPLEIAQNFKEQGNEAYLEKRFRDALEFYSKGLAAKSGDATLDRLLLLNRAAVNLELGNLSFSTVYLWALGWQLMVENYGNVLKDCGKVLIADEGNVKALYRSAKACYALDKMTEAEDAVSRALKLDPKNSAAKTLLKDIQQKRNVVESRNQQSQSREARKRDEDRALKAALQTREIRIIRTPGGPPDLGPIQTYHLSDPLNPGSDLIFPCLIFYPLNYQSDVISEFPLSTTINEQLSVVLEQRPSWDARREYTLDNVDVWMEHEVGARALGRGLLKLDKDKPVEEQLKGKNLDDGILAICVVPTSRANEFLQSWRKSLKTGSF